MFLDMVKPQLSADEFLDLPYICRSKESKSSQFPADSEWCMKLIASMGFIVNGINEYPYAPGMIYLPTFG